MEKFLPLFPLNLVAYPGEDLNLHIFEPRYRQLINECIDSDITFGLPPFIDNRLPGLGTEMRIRTLHKRYDDGRMDIKTTGLGVFRMLDFESPVVGKLYAGGIVEFLDTTDTPAIDNPQLTDFIKRLERLYDLLQIEVDYDPMLPNLSYSVAHKVGMSIEQEYELLTILTETARQQFISQHLDKVLPVVAEMERTKQRIRMNGHFKNLDPLAF